MCSRRAKGAKIPDQLTVIDGATALLGDRLEPVRDSVVLLHKDAIAGAGPRSEVELPTGAEVVDATGLTLLPGFIDAHVHIGFYPPAKVLAGGVTTVRDLAWPPDVIHPLARASRRPGFNGPLILAAGPMLTVTGGYPTRAGWAPPRTGLVIDSPAAARTAVERTAAEGACVIKVALNDAVGPTLSPELLGAIVERAHSLELKVTGHVHGLGELVKALDAGMDELAHMLLSGEPIPGEIIARMVEAGMGVVPTLSCFFGRRRLRAIANLARLREAGGRAIYGTDLGNQGPRPGIDRREVNAMHKAGYSGQDIVRAATVDAAAWMGLAERGSIAPGKVADLVAVGGNPLERAGDLTKVEGVWRAGSRVL